MNLRSYYFKGMDTGDTTEVVITKTGNEQLDWEEAYGEAVFNLCEDVEEIDKEEYEAIDLGGDEVAPEWSNKYLNTLGMSMSDFC